MMKVVPGSASVSRQPRTPLLLSWWPAQAEVRHVARQSGGGHTYTWVREGDREQGRASLLRSRHAERDDK